MDNYYSKRDTLKTLGISHMTLIKLVQTEKIEYIKTVGGQRKYNVVKYINDNMVKTKHEKVAETLQTTVKQNICYVRVSTSGQQNDLVRQREYMKMKYPTYEIIEDIGSGINFNRKGFRKIINLAIAGKINVLVVAFKDRLTRFGYELIEDLIKEYSNGTIKIEEDKEDKDPKEELVDDVLQILNVYTAKINGMRKYSKLMQK